MIGKGRMAANKLSTYMDLPKPVSDEYWGKHTTLLRDVSSSCSEQSMDAAALKLKRLKLKDATTIDLDDDDVLRDTIVDCSVSVDGSWMTRGFHSRHAFVSVISMDTGECLDRVYMCSTCTKCRQWKDKSTSGDYLQFYEKHFPE